MCEFIPHFNSNNVMSARRVEADTHTSKRTHQNKKRRTNWQIIRARTERSIHKRACVSMYWRAYVRIIMRTEYIYKYMAFGMRDGEEAFFE